MRHGGLFCATALKGCGQSVYDVGEFFCYNAPHSLPERACMPASVAVTPPSLLCRVGAALCALPVLLVGETMRPLPIEPVTGMPSFLLGLAIIRGMPVPVLDARRLLGRTHAGSPGRFVTIRVGERYVALAVDAVVGLRAIPAAALGEMPPLLRDSGSEIVSAIGTLDAALFVVLQLGRLMPDAVMALLGGDAPA
jgi:purine-binding chemotaxis protein CheW